MTDSRPEIDGGIMFDGLIELSSQCPDQCESEDFCRDSVDIANEVICQIYGGQVMAVANVNVRCPGPEIEDAMPLENGSELISYKCGAQAVVSAFDAEGEELHRVMIERNSSDVDEPM